MKTSYKRVCIYMGRMSRATCVRVSHHVRVQQHSDYAHRKKIRLSVCLSVHLVRPGAAQHTMACGIVDSSIATGTAQHSMACGIVDSSIAAGTANTMACGIVAAGIR
jgi:hypothetical protein